MGFAHPHIPSEGGGEFPHEGSVGARFFAAQSVVEMEDGQCKIPLTGEFREQVPQTSTESAPPETATPTRAARYNGS